MAFIDLSAAYDTLNHNLLLKKTYQITQDFKFVQIIESLLRNRRFFVTLADKYSRWRISKNKLPQGNVLTPILYNLYTNDLYKSNDDKIKHFMYTEDAAIVVQDNNFEIIEEKLTKVTKTLENTSKIHYTL